MLGTISQPTYESIVEGWVRTITLLSESEIHVWSALNCSYTILNQFAHDIQLQNKLFGKLPRKLVFIDGYEIQNPTWEEFENQFFHFLDEQKPKKFNMDEYIGQHPNDFFAIFMIGYDTAIKHGNIDILKHIGSLLEKHSHLSLILLTEQNITDSDIYTDLIQKHMVVENIQYQPLFSFEDSLFFLQSLAKDWEFTFPNDMEKVIAENIGGHTLLLEEAARLVRDNPTIEFKALLAHPSLIRKAKTIFKALSTSDQEIMKHVLENRLQKTHVSEYLAKTKLVDKGKSGIPYWQYMHDWLPEEKEFFQLPHKHVVEFSHTLTVLERKVFDKLIETQNIISRDEIAHYIWGEDYLDKYSDWAIDQLMHRLRGKLQISEAPYRIHTKKGEGFYLEEV